MQEISHRADSIHLWSYLSRLLQWKSGPCPGDPLWPAPHNYISSQTFINLKFVRKFSNLPNMQSNNFLVTPNDRRPSNCNKIINDRAWTISRSQHQLWRTVWTRGLRAVTRTWFNSTRRLDGTRSQIRVIQGDCKVSMHTQVKQWSAVKLQTALVCTANELFYARIAEGNFHRAKIDTPLLLPNTSVLVTLQTMVHEDRGTYLLHFNSVIVHKWSLSWWITAECRLL